MGSLFLVEEKDCIELQAKGIDPRPMHVLPVVPCSTNSASGAGGKQARCVVYMVLVVVLMLTWAAGRLQRGSGDVSGRLCWLCMLWGVQIE